MERMVPSVLYTIIVKIGEAVTYNAYFSAHLGCLDDHSVWIQKVTGPLPSPPAAQAVRYILDIPQSQAGTRTAKISALQISSQYGIGGQSVK
jgi:hypothetical protein